MGSAASAVDDRALIVNEIKAQLNKPTDCSDVTDLESAQLEIMKIRNFFRMIDVNGIENALRIYESASDQSKEDAHVQNSMSSRAREIRGLAIVSMLKNKMEQRFNSLSDTFLSIDTDGSGYITQSEFQEACFRWGIILTPEDFELINATYSHEEKAGTMDKGINYREFIALMTQQMRYREGNESCHIDLGDIIRSRIMSDVDTMREAFKKTDRDGSGTVERSELRSVIFGYDLECSDESLDAIFSAYDRNGDGKFSYGEFVQLLQNAR